MQTFPRHTVVRTVALLLAPAWFAAVTPAMAEPEDDGEALPRFEISVSYVANLVHWVDNLAGSSGGKNVRTYRRYWQSRFGAPGQAEMELLLRWDALRSKAVDIPQGKPGNETGCLPHVEDDPGWRQIFLLRSYEAPSIEAFADSLSGQLDGDERTELRRILETFEPRFEKAWRSMSHMKPFEDRFRRYIDQSGLRPFLGEVARFLGVNPKEFPPGKLHLMALPEESATFATAIGRHLMMEIRPGDGPEDQVQVIAHETAHYLWQMLTPGQLDDLATQIHSASPAGPVLWMLLREGLPTALGQGMAEARLVPRRFREGNIWYHIPSIDRFAREIYPSLVESFERGESIRQGFLPRIAQSVAGPLSATAPPSDYLLEAVHAVGSGMLPAYTQVIRERPARHRWLFTAAAPEASAFLDRYHCLGGLIFLGPGEAASSGSTSSITTEGGSASRASGAQDSRQADPPPVADGTGGASQPLRSGVYPVRRSGGGVLIRLVAAREEDIPRVADLFLRLRRLPGSPVFLEEADR